MPCKFFSPKANEGLYGLYDKPYLLLLAITAVAFFYEDREPTREDQKHHEQIFFDVFYCFFMSLETFVMIVSDLDVLRGLEVMVRPSLRFLRGFWGSFTNDVHSHVNQLGPLTRKKGVAFFSMIYLIIY